MTPHELAVETLKKLREKAEKDGTPVSRAGISHSDLDLTYFIFNDMELQTYSEAGAWKIRHRTLGDKNWSDDELF